MKSYQVMIAADVPGDWSAVGKARLENHLWGTDYKPETYAQIVYADTKNKKAGLYIHLFCAEADPVSRYHKHNEPVYLDSCMEFFFTMHAPGKPDNGYVNIECNSDPTTLIGFGVERNGRVSIVDLGVEPFPVTVKKTAETWELFEFVPEAVLLRLFGLDRITPETVFKGNIYKCGGDHAVEPYSSWAPIDTPAPDFHRPEMFGEFRLVR